MNSSVVYHLGTRNLKQQTFGGYICLEEVTDSCSDTGLVIHLDF